MKKLFLFLFLCSCAADPDPVPTIDVKPPAQRLAPPVSEDIEPKSNCVLDSHWAGNCEVTSTICDNVIKDIEVKCGLGRKLFPWEYIPDPPYDRTQ